MEWARRLREIKAPYCGCGARGSELAADERMGLEHDSLTL